MSTIPNLKAMSETMDSLAANAQPVLHSEPAQKAAGWFKGIVERVKSWHQSEETLARFNKASRKISLWEKAPTKWHRDKVSGDLYAFVPEIEADYLMPKIQKATERLGFSKDSVVSYISSTRGGPLARKFNNFERFGNAAPTQEALKEGFQSSFGKTKITVSKDVASDPAFIRHILETHNPADKQKIPDIAEAWIATAKEHTYTHSR